LEEVDLHCFKSLETLLEIEKEGITKETFADTIFFNFTTNSIDGREVELIPNGKNIDVKYVVFLPCASFIRISYNSMKRTHSWDNRAQYVKLVENYKLNECKLQMQAIYEGLSPPHISPRKIPLNTYFPLIGLAAIVPLGYLKLLLPKELEQKGACVIDSFFC